MGPKEFYLTAHTSAGHKGGAIHEEDKLNSEQNIFDIQKSVVNTSAKTSNLNRNEGVMDMTSIHGSCHSLASVDVQSENSHVDGGVMGIGSGGSTVSNLAGHSEVADSQILKDCTTGILEDHGVAIVKKMCLFSGGVNSIVGDSPESKVEGSLAKVESWKGGKYGSQRGPVLLIQKDESICKYAEDKHNFHLQCSTLKDDSREQLRKNTELEKDLNIVLQNAECDTTDVLVSEFPVTKSISSNPIQELRETRNGAGHVSVNHGLYQISCDSGNCNNPVICKSKLSFLPEIFGGIPGDGGFAMVKIGWSTPGKIMEKEEDLFEEVMGIDDSVSLPPSVGRPENVIGNGSHGFPFHSTVSDYKIKYITEVPQVGHPSKFCFFHPKDESLTGKYEREFLESEPFQFVAEKSNKFEGNLGWVYPSHDHASSAVLHSVQNEGLRKVEAVIIKPTFMGFLAECHGRPAISAPDFKISSPLETDSGSSQIPDTTMGSTDVINSSTGRKVVSSSEELEQVSSEMTEDAADFSAANHPMPTTMEDTFPYVESLVNAQKSLLKSEEEATQDILKKDLKTGNGDDALMVDAQKVDINLYSSDHSRSSSEDESAFEIWEFFDSLENNLVSFEPQQDSSQLTPVLDDLNNAPSSLETAGSFNVPLFSEKKLMSDETNISGLSKDKDTDGSGVLDQANKVAQLVDSRKNIGVNSINLSFQDELGSISEKWQDDIEAAESISTTFSGSVPYSGPIAYSGPIFYSGTIPYSGSISLRSDSSTASTHSFAFPILASEWNSSPVKMAQPDRRFLRRKWRWRKLCICCKRPSTLFD